MKRKRDESKEREENRASTEGGRKEWVFKEPRDDTTAKPPGNYVNIYEPSLAAALTAPPLESRYLQKDQRA